MHAANMRALVYDQHDDYLLRLALDLNQSHAVDHLCYSLDLSSNTNLSDSKYLQRTVCALGLNTCYC